MHNFLSNTTLIKEDLRNYRVSILVFRECNHHTSWNCKIQIRSTPMPTPSYPTPHIYTQTNANEQDEKKLNFSCMTKTHTILVYLQKDKHKISHILRQLQQQLGVFFDAGSNDHLTYYYHQNPEQTYLPCRSLFPIKIVCQCLSKMSGQLHRPSKNIILNIFFFTFLFLHDT